MPLRLMASSSSWDRSFEQKKPLLAGMEMSNSKVSALACRKGALSDSLSGSVALGGGDPRTEVLGVVRYYLVPLCIPNS